jgi:hypothetical protein
MVKLFRLALATYRIARLFAIDEGPFNAFSRLRYLMGAYDLAENGKPESTWGRMISCPHCMGLYAAAFVMVLPKQLGWFVDLLAVAGLQSWLQSMTGETGE